MTWGFSQVFPIANIESENAHPLTLMLLPEAFVSELPLVCVHTIDSPRLPGSLYSFDEYEMLGPQCVARVHGDERQLQRPFE